MSIADEKFVSVATFRKSGAAVATPTWIVPLDDGRVGFWTSSSAGKTKRLRTNPVVTVQACNQRGKITDGSQEIDGTAVLVSSGPEFDAIQAKVRSKYGAMVPISRFFNTLGHIGKSKFPYGDLGVVITLD